jgi:hypothetical protein
MSHQYILDANHIAIPVFDLMKWAMWFETNRAVCRVALDEVQDWSVSTVFLGLDHNFSSTGDPVLFETMVFDEDHLSHGMERYSSWAEAAAGHERIKSMLEYEMAQGKRNTVDMLAALLKRRHAV